MGRQWRRRGQEREEYVRQVLARWEGSGLTKVGFCRREGISTVALRRWLGEFREGVLHPQGGFVEVRLPSPVAPPASFELDLVSGRRPRLPRTAFPGRAFPQGPPRPWARRHSSSTYPRQHDVEFPRLELAPPHRGTAPAPHAVLVSAAPGRRPSRWRPDLCGLGLGELPVEAGLRFSRVVEVLPREVFDPETLTVVAALPGAVTAALRVGDRVVWGLYFGGVAKDVTAEFEVVLHLRAERRLQVVGAEAKGGRRVRPRPGPPGRPDPPELPPAHGSRGVRSIETASENPGSVQAYRGLLLALQRLGAEDTRLGLLAARARGRSREAEKAAGVARPGGPVPLHPAFAASARGRRGRHRRRPADGQRLPGRRPLLLRVAGPRGEVAREPRRPRRPGPGRGTNPGAPGAHRGGGLPAGGLGRAGPGPAYLLAATTGLRRSELASLAWEDVDLEAATGRVRAASAKNRREAVLPLPAGTVAVLGRLRGDEQLPTARVLRSVPNTSTLRKDLTRAKIPFATPDGVVDLHALRVTYGTLLARAGVSLAQAQKLMRHSTPVLTANVYVKLQMDDAREAVAKIDVGVGAESGASSPPRKAAAR